MTSKLQEALNKIDVSLGQETMKVSAQRNEPFTAMYLADPTFSGTALIGLSMTQDVCHQLAVKSGWWKDVETGEDVLDWPKKYRDLLISTKLMLTVTEVAEAMEGHRKGLKDDHLTHRDMLEVELADTVIRVLDLAGALKMDVAGAIMEKLAYNQQRADHKIENRAAEGGKTL